MRAIAVMLAITGALAVSGIAAASQAEQHKCNPTGGRYPGYTGPYAYAAYYYGYPPDCGGISFYLAPTFYGYGYPQYRVPTQRKHGMKGVSW